MPKLRVAKIKGFTVFCKAASVEFGVHIVYTMKTISLQMYSVLRVGHRYQHFPSSTVCQCIAVLILGSILLLDV